ncbi:hypothetical protein [Halorhabdus rudnickae]|uniref:hypothetical protein n=1 Tax=Halorhabdus rudnickae TaxID=1775544 RepID=UPI001082C4C1|nr:hypothetical protein [Halorhabdus rudnickae]
MSSNPNRRPIRSEYRPTTTDNPEMADGEPREGTPTAPSMFTPADRSNLPEMFDAEADYQDR